MGSEEMYIPRSKKKNQRKWMKGVPIPHLAKESTGAEALLLSKPTVSINQK